MGLSLPEMSSDASEGTESNNYSSSGAYAHGSIDTVVPTPLAPLLRCHRGGASIRPVGLAQYLKVTLEEG